MWSEAVTAAALLVALGLSRRRPRASWTLAAGTLVVSAAAGVTPGGQDFATYALVAAQGFCTGRWARGLAGLAALLGALALLVVAEPDLQVGTVLLVGGGWAAGRVVRDRERLATALADRARDLDAERETHAELSVRYERARIAAELHDIVAHAISVMVVQASAGQRLAARDPELADEAFAAIAGAARQAEDDMGRLVALLGDARAVGAAPDLELVEELVARAAASGLDVTLRLEGEREGLPAQLASVAFTVAQEGLTNALRYACGAAVTIAVRGESDTLSVEVVNGAGDRNATLAGDGTGNGLLGLRERVGACGGSLDAGPTAQGGWRLRARLPRRVAATA